MVIAEQIAPMLAAYKQLLPHLTTSRLSLQAVPSFLLLQS